MRKHLCFLALAAGLCCSPALAASDAWYGGGWYDGYDQLSSPVVIGYPQVNNADGATNITASSAWLNGTLMATGSAPTTVYVYWGVTNGVTNKASWGATNNFGACVEDAALTTNVFVNSNTTYYYRFYATNTAGEEAWASASASFLTAGAPTLDTGIGALPVSYTNATLNGNLTLGGSALIYVYYGLTDGVTTNNNWGHTNNLGTNSMGAFYTPVSGLSTGTLYYYRCYGTNAYGAGWSDTMAFTTRVLSVTFSGGSYDGYDRRDGQPQMQSYKGGVFSIR